MTDDEIEILQNLREMGLIFQRKRTDTSFYTTDLMCAISQRNISKKNHDNSDSITSLDILGQPSPISGSKETDNRFIVVESNMHLYAYTNSALKLALISLFCKIKYQFANIIAGSLTKRSIQTALRAGIGAIE
ncbi:MAG: General transcription factor IIH subunit 4, partial [Paramarteilia canceri]